MLLRFSVKNLFSFNDETEFNLLPGRISRLSHHKYSKAGIEFLKLSALYGANGAGKSNLIKAISLLKQLVKTGIIPSELNSQKFKLSPKKSKDYTDLEIEFIKNEKAFYYSIKLNEGIVLEEQFCISGLGKKADQILFHRTIDSNSSTQIKFFDGFEESKENVLLKTVIEKDLIKPDKPLIHLLQSLSSETFNDIKSASDWFSKNLTIIEPDFMPNGLTMKIDKLPEFKNFAIDMVKSFQTGIVDLKIETNSIEDFFGEDNQKEIDRITGKLKQNPKLVVPLRNRYSHEEVSFVNEDDKIVSKRLVLEHKGEKNEMVKFSFDEESDGTRRLIEYIPALESVINREMVIIIDEIERSIHPLIVKELISKFSLDEKTQGQLIFSTHESNLLDQEIFRQDEIWFAEKNKIGATELYPLSEFKIDGQKEHHTIDIQKGYLSGRYGAIPFSGNLTDLNWHKYHNA